MRKLFIEPLSRIRPAPGAAVTMVLGVACGGGVGLSDRKRGWMSASLSPEFMRYELAGIFRKLPAADWGRDNATGETIGELGQLPGMVSSITCRGVDDSSTAWRV